MAAIYSPEQHAFYRELGHFMKKARKAREMSCEELSYQTEVSRSTIVGVERGNYKISAYLLLRLFESLEIPVHVLQELKAIARKKTIKGGKPHEVHLGA